MEVDSDDDPFDALGGGKARRMAIKRARLDSERHLSLLCEPGVAIGVSSGAVALSSPLATTSPDRASASRPAPAAQASTNLGIVAASSPRPAAPPPALVSGTPPEPLASVHPAFRISTAVAMAVAPPPLPAKPSAARAKREAAAAEAFQRKLNRIQAEEARLAAVKALLRPGVPRKLPAHGDIVDDAKSTSSGDLTIWTAHCQQAIIDGMTQATVFKIGISSCPQHRWLNLRYGYYLTESWRWMQLVLDGTTDQSKAMERRLIAWAQEVYPSACANKKPGGEGIAKDTSSQLYVYIVFEDSSKASLRSNAWSLNSYHSKLCDTCQRYRFEDGV